VPMHHPPPLNIPLANPERIDSPSEPAHNGQDLFLGHVTFTPAVIHRLREALVASGEDADTFTDAEVMEMAENSIYLVRLLKYFGQRGP